MNSIPVFLLSSVRSGSSLLRLMLDSHPRISNPGECDFMFDMVSETGHLPPLKEYYKWLSTNRIFQAKNLKVDNSLSYSKLIESFLDQLQSKDRTLCTNIHRHFHRIPSVFPEAKYIHLLRDPRDVARSCIGMGWVGHVYFGVNIWKEAEESWNKLKLTLNHDDYLEVKYEDILEDVEKYLGIISEFLGFKFDHQMLDYAKTSTYALPNKALSYQWVSKLSDQEIQLVESKIAKMIENRGYKLSGLPIIKPGIIEVILLKIKNGLYRRNFQIRKYGLILFFSLRLSSLLKLSSWHDSCQQKINIIDIKGLK